MTEKIQSEDYQMQQTDRYIIIIIMSSHSPVVPIIHHAVLLDYFLRPY